MGTNSVINFWHAASTLSCTRNCAVYEKLLSKRCSSAARLAKSAASRSALVGRLERLRAAGRAWRAGQAHEVLS